MENGSKQPMFDKPAVYRIRVQGTLDESWSNRMGGMRILNDETKQKKKITILFGYLPDQSALAGILTSLNDLALTILSVECLSED